MKKTECFYMAITDDKYELPIAVAETQKELARMVGIDVSQVCRSIKLQEQNIWTNFIKIPKNGEFNLPPRHNKVQKKRDKSIIGNGKRYNSISDAAKEYGVSSATIIYWIKTRNGWEYQDKE